MARTLNVLGSNYKIIPASTTKWLGPDDAAGDYLSHLLINPTTVAPGDVTVKDGDVTVMTCDFGTLANTVPFVIPIGLRSVHGGWNITCGANVAVVAAGTFTHVTNVVVDDVTAGAPVVDEPVVTPEA